LRGVLFGVAVVAAHLPAGAAAQSSVQQDFDAAQAALTARDIPAARQRFEALLKRLPQAPGNRSAALVKARLGSALVLDGEPEAAEQLLSEAIAVLAKPTQADTEERTMALVDRAKAREAIGLFRGAAEDLRAAREAGLFPPGAVLDVTTKAALARVLIWSEPREAARLLDELAALPPATWGESRDALALVHALRGRVELNGPDPAAALPHLRRAAQLSGGTSSTRINLTDARVRGDLAIAYYLTGQREEQQRLVAYSGGGTAPAKGLGRAASQPLPACGEATELAPDDVAVVEFGIGDNGRVGAVTPVLVKRAGAPAAGSPPPETLFVQAVRDWFWNVGDVAALDPFWRQAIRVELRCDSARPESNLVGSSMAAAAAQALDRLGVRPRPPLPDNDAAALPLIRAELAAREAADGASSVQLLAPLMALSRSNSAAPAEERVAATRREITLLEAAGTEPGALAVARVWLAQAEGWDLRKAQRERLVRDRLRPLLASEEARAPDARSTNYVRLTLAEAHDALREPAEASALLERIAATQEGALGRADPIRTAALLRLSNIAAAGRDMARAATALEATGLTPEQCALVDVRPEPRNMRVTSDDFPEMARRWGSSGFARVSYDITADGRPVNVRAVVASPPFTFAEATAKAAESFRFQPVFRPGNTLGCVGNSQNFRFAFGL
jgi:TonB family protein